MPNSVQFLFIANDPFIKIALPYRCAGVIAQLIDSFGNGGFE